MYKVMMNNEFLVLHMKKWVNLKSQENNAK